MSDSNEDRGTTSKIEEKFASLSSYSIANSAYLALQALPLLLTPGLLVTLWTPHARDATDFERHLCHLLGVTSLLAAAIPLPATDAGQYSWLHWTAVLLYHTFVFLISYIRWQTDGQGLLLLAMLGSGTLWTWGMFSLFFGNETWHTRSSYLFPKSEKRRMQVEKRERRFGKLEKKLG